MPKIQDEAERLVGSVREMRRWPVILVVGSRDEKRADDWSDRAETVGQLLAQMPVHLLTGAGPAAMAAVSQAFVEWRSQDGRPAEGKCIGIVPCDAADPAKPKKGYPNPFVEIAIHTHLPGGLGKEKSNESRNHINVLTADGIIALPGGAGTLAEIELAAVNKEKRIIAYVDNRKMIEGLPKGIRNQGGKEALMVFLLDVFRDVLRQRSTSGRP
ncbi:hypothetical protein [Mesorhizobium sp. M0013]|uniref:SLOG cluster 4 domain-containing protein n=1 Tax=Mesorhizobium sp. M0013 TaxID=2956841 RepID=UPI00333AC4FF